MVTYRMMVKQAGRKSGWQAGRQGGKQSENQNCREASSNTVKEASSQAGDISPLIVQKFT